MSGSEADDVIRATFTHDGLRYQASFDRRKGTGQATTGSTLAALFHVVGDADGRLAIEFRRKPHVSRALAREILGRLGLAAD